MEKSPTEARDGDIAQEKYQGPSAAVAAMGGGAIEHLVWGLATLAAGAGVALFFPQKVATLLKDWREAAATAKASTETGFIPAIKRGLGSLTHGLIGEGRGALNISADGADAAHKEWAKTEIMNKERGFGHWFVSHIFLGPLPYIGKKGKKVLLELASAEVASKGEHLTNVLTVGGAVGAIGYAGGLVKGTIEGAAHADQGKEQFTRAQDEVRELRRVNGTLERANEEIRQKYVETATQLRDAKTGKPIRVSGDDAGTNSLETGADNLTSHDASTASSPVASVALDEKQHHGMLHAHAPEVGAAVGG